MLRRTTPGFRGTQWKVVYAAFVSVCCCGGAQITALKLFNVELPVLVEVYGIVPWRVENTFGEAVLLVW